MQRGIGGKEVISKESIILGKVNFLGEMKGSIKKFPSAGQKILVLIGQRLHFQAVETAVSLGIKSGFNDLGP